MTSYYSVPYKLNIYLVEYEDNDLFGIATLPPSDRGYAKNEIVAAVVELFVPKGENPWPTYVSFEFGGENVNLQVADNNIVYNSGLDNYTATIPYSNSPSGTMTVLYIKDKDKLMFGPKKTTLYNSESDETYKWLFFAKVEDDDASLFTKLVDGTSGFELDSTHSNIPVTLDGVDYNIARSDNAYTITISDADSDYNGAIITIDVDDDNVSEGMTISFDGDTYPLGVNTKNELGIVDNAKILTSGDEYDNIMDVYNDVVVDVFKLDYFLIGNYVRNSFFNKLTSSDTIVATVDIAPWTAYVTVPDNIVVDPPKTGDAASVMGFVMVALSSAGAYLLRKRG